MQNNPIVEVNQVSMKFNLASEKYDSFKEYFIKTLKKQISYNEFWALTDVSFSLEKGESLGLIGLNGSGKSTMLKIIAGVLKPTRGNVMVRGNVAPLIELGAGFDYDLTAGENIYLNGTMNGFSEKEIDERMQDILDFADIGDYVKQPVKTYSSGMFVRLAFSV